MAEFEDKLNAILADPEAMGQIVSIAKALTGETSSSEAGTLPPEGTAPEAPAASPAPAEEPEAPRTQPDWGAVLGMLGSLNSGGTGSPLSALGDLDPRLIQTAVALFSEYSATDDRKIALLTAMKPFLKPERYAKVDKAVQIARLSRVIRAAFQLFKKSGEEEADV